MKRIIVISTTIIGLTLIFYFNLLSRYNAVTAMFDLWTVGLIYPQCEFSGKELDRFQPVASELRIEVRHVECEKFYTRGMKQYYSIMESRLNNKHGKEWLVKLNGKN